MGVFSELLPADTLDKKPKNFKEKRVGRMNELPRSAAEQSADAPVFERLGTIIRSLHDALCELGAEKMLAEVASEFPSARQRLLHIADLTENAANTVLTKVEQVNPVQDRLGRMAKHLHDEWTHAARDALVPDQLQLLADQTSLFMSATQIGCETTRTALSEIMMAQDFQDLSGQLIKKVVTLLAHTENDLLKMLLDAAPAGMVSQNKKEEITAGPSAPGSVALEQTAVDDLLADLGF
jgi:chemotaxis protein CheZ